MWIVRECDICKAEAAAIMCDHCGCKACVCCATLLEEMILDGYGGEYREICNRCAQGISVDGASFADGPSLIIHGGGGKTTPRKETNLLMLDGGKDGES